MLGDVALERVEQRRVELEALDQRRRVGARLGGQLGEVPAALLVRPVVEA